MKLSFTETGWNDYLYWQTEDKKTVKQINKLLVGDENVEILQCRGHYGDK